MSKNDKKAFGSSLANKVKKLGELTIKVRKQKEEAKKNSKGTETQDAEIENRTVARVLKQDGEIIETSGTLDAQQSGDFKKVLKQAGVKDKDVRYTSPSKNAEEMGDNRIEDSVQEEVKAENLKKADKITEIAKTKANAEANKKRKRDSVANMMRLLKTVSEVMKQKKNTTPKEAGIPIDISGALRNPSEIPNNIYKIEDLDKNNQPKLFHAEWTQEDQNKETALEMAIEEKVKRHLNKQPLTKADQPEDTTLKDTLKRQRVERVAQQNIEGYQPQMKLQNKTKGKAPTFKLLTESESNTKTEKNNKFDQYSSVILHLAPHTIAGVGDLCVAAQDCKFDCLNTSGRGGMGIKENDNTLEGLSKVHAARIRKTRQLIQNPGKFMDDLIADIHKHDLYAKRDGKKTVVRLNGTSDFAWEDFRLPHFGGKNIFEAFPDIQFYDYTKRPDRVIKNKHHNYHLTFSRDTKNERVAKHLLDAGHNVSVVFGGDTLPTHYLGRPVISGDEHDLRFLDEKHPDGRGVIVGLKAKGSGAKSKSKFIVRDYEGYAPQKRPIVGNLDYNKLREFADRDAASKDLKKAKFEETYDPSAKRKVRDKRRSQPKDPMANKKPGRVAWLAGQKKAPADKVHPATQEELENISAKVKMKKADDSGKWLTNKNKKLPSPPESVLPPPKPKKDNGKDAPVINYSEINKITTKPASGSLDYSKFPPPPDKDPNWKKKLEFNNPKPKDPPQSRGVVRTPQEPKPRAIIRKEDMKKADDTKNPLADKFRNAFRSIFDEHIKQLDGPPSEQKDFWKKHVGNSHTQNMNLIDYAEKNGHIDALYNYIQQNQKTPQPDQHKLFDALPEGLRAQLRQNDMLGPSPFGSNPGTYRLFWALNSDNVPAAPTEAHLPSDTQPKQNPVKKPVAKKVLKPMKKGNLTKDNKPHAPGSPEDSAHDVAEEGSSIKSELKALKTPDRMSKMLTHLRGLKAQQALRSKENQKEGLAKQDPQLDASGVASMKNAFGGGSTTPPPPPPPADTSSGNDMLSGIKAGFDKVMGKSKDELSPSGNDVKKQLEQNIHNLKNRPPMGILKIDNENDDKRKRLETEHQRRYGSMGKSELYKNCSSRLSKCREYLKKGKLIDIKTGKAPEKTPKTSQSQQLFALDRRLKGEKPKAVPKPKTESKAPID